MKCLFPPISLLNTHLQRKRLLVLNRCRLFADKGATPPPRLRGTKPLPRCESKGSPPPPRTLAAYPFTALTLIKFGRTCAHTRTSLPPLKTKKNPPCTGGRDGHQMPPLVPGGAPQHPPAAAPTCSHFQPPVKQNPPPAPSSTRGTHATLPR